MGNRLSKQSQEELKAGLVAILEVVEKGFDGVPIPGVKGCIGGILVLIKQQEEFHAVSVVRLEELDEPSMPQGLKDDIVKLSEKLRSIPERYQSIVGPSPSKRRIKNFLVAKSHAEALNKMAKELGDALMAFTTGSLTNIQIALANLQQENKKREVAAEQRRIAKEERRNADEGRKKREDEQRMEDERQRRIAKEERRKREEEQRKEEGRQLEIGRIIEKFGESDFVERKALWDAHREHPVQLCMDGTRVDVLKSVATWSAHSDPHNSLLWLNGRAGMGKSTIARTLAKQLAAEGILGASFMFSRPNGVTDGSKVFTTLAHQLARHLDGFRDHLADALQAKGDSVSAEIPQQCQDILTAPLSQLREHRSNAVIIIDALYECTDGTLKPVLSCILDSLTQFNFLRIIVTSRPEHPIRDLIQEFAEHVHNLDLHAVAADQDVRFYLKYHLNESYHKIKRSTPDDIIWPPPDKLESLGQLAGGLFIFAVTALRFIGDERAGNPDRRLDLILEGQQHPGQSRPFDKLDRMYNDILGEALREGDDDLFARFQAVLGLIIFSHESPSITEMERLLRRSENQYDADSIFTALKYLHSVIVIPPEVYQGVHVYHQSFADFITDPLRCTLRGAFLSSLAHHERLFVMITKSMIAGLPTMNLSNELVAGLYIMYLTVTIGRELDSCSYHLTSIKHHNSEDTLIEDSLLVVQKAGRDFLIHVWEYSEQVQPPFRSSMVKSLARSVATVKRRATQLAKQAGLHARTDDVEDDHSSDSVRSEASSNSGSLGSLWEGSQDSDDS